MQRINFFNNVKFADFEQQKIPLSFDKFCDTRTKEIFRQADSFPVFRYIVYQDVLRQRN